MSHGRQCPSISDEWGTGPGNLTSRHLFLFKEFTLDDLLSGPAAEKYTWLEHVTLACQASDDQQLLAAGSADAERAFMARWLNGAGQNP